MKPPYQCLYCGAPSWKDPSEQTPPPSYCHPEDHGNKEDHWDQDDLPNGVPVESLGR